MHTWTPNEHTSSADTPASMAHLHGIDALIQVEEGFGYGMFEDVCETYGITKSKLADILNIPRANLQRRQQSGSLNQDESDKLLRFVRIMRMAKHVLTDQAQALQWMKRPIIQMDGKLPFDLLATEAGAREVENLLLSIEHGMFS